MFDDLFSFVMTVVVFAVPILLIALFLGGIVFGIRAWTHNVDTASCRVFAVEANRETKFVDYTFWTWDCLTPVEDGTWISVDKLRGSTES